MLKNKFIYDFDTFTEMNEVKRGMSKYHDPEITIDNNSRTAMVNVAQIFKTIILVFNENRLGILVAAFEDLKEDELLHKDKEWDEKFDMLQKLLWGFYAAIYVGYSRSLNILRHVIDDFEMTVLVNKEPIKNVRLIDRNLYKSMLLYDPDIRRYRDNLEKVWDFIKTNFPAQIMDTVNILEEMGIDVYDERRKQLKPPKIILKSKDFSGSGKGKKKLNYSRLIDAASSIDAHGGWESPEKGEIMDTYVQYLETQGEVEDVIPYDITPKGLK